MSRRGRSCRGSRRQGADLTKVHILESIILANGSEILPGLRADMDAITAAAANLGDCWLIVVDPVSAYVIEDRGSGARVEWLREPIPAVSYTWRSALTASCSFPEATTV